MGEVEDGQGDDRGADDRDNQRRERNNRAEMPLEFASIKGIKNKFFGDSLFLAQLHGPGHVWLQSMTPAKLAAAIEPYLPDKTSSSDGN